MFRMAKKILAIDGSSSGGGGGGGGSGKNAGLEPQRSAGAPGGSGGAAKPQRSGSKEHKDSSKRAQKGAQAEQLEQQPPLPPHKSINRPPMSTEELNDFSKLEDDPRLPLSVRQIFKITKSWKAIARATSKTGTVMFLNLFEQNKDLFYLFDRFQHLKGKELHESMELREHAATVMSTLDQSINLLSDYDNFVAYLHSIGKLHRKVPDFKREHFWKIEQPFLTAVKQTLDERCNETIEQIYKIAIKLIIETIADGYSRADSFAADAADLDADKAPASGACGGASGAAPGGVVGGGGGSSGRGKSDGTALSKSGAVNDNDNGNGNGNGTGNGGSFAAAAAGSCPVLASGGCKRP